jgi:glycosyltransferase involved in cell wall biosynthesis
LPQGAGPTIGGMQPLLEQQPPAADPAGVLVEVVVPAHNEQRVLEASVRRLHGYLATSFPFPYRITIADNASTDGTWLAAKRLAEALPRVRAAHVPLKGRGRALRQVWEASDADVSTGLEALLPLVAPVSRCYNLLLRSTLRARFSDAQCGFKAGRADVVRALLPTVEDQAWFFDTELLLAAQRDGLRIHEVPVDWVEDTDSRVDVVRTALDDLRGMARVARRQLPSFAAIGAMAANAAATAARFALLRSRVFHPRRANLNRRHT